MQGEESRRVVIFGEILNSSEGLGLLVGKENVWVIDNLKHLVLRTCCRRLEMLSYLVYIGVSLFGLFA